MEKKLRCEKCNDRFDTKFGLLSNRSSCRHHYWENGHCRDCKQNKKDKHIRYNCYHKAIVKSCPCTIS
jgi:hypothetical protein